MTASTLVALSIPRMDLPICIMLGDAARPWVFTTIVHYSYYKLHSLLIIINMCTESCHPILHIPECTETIFRALPRNDPKSLRLTSIIFEYVVLKESNLFSRAYISCAGPDISVLGKLSASHLRECVTELVWDITAAPPAYLREALPDPLDRLALGDIIRSWAGNARKATDFEILLKAFAAFPKLNSVIFIELIGSLAGPQPPNDRLYESPAVRKWLELGASGLLDIIRSAETPLSSAMVTRTMHWAMEYIRRGSVDRDWSPQLEIGRYMNTPYLSPTLSLVAMSVLKDNLKPLLVEATPEMFPTTMVDWHRMLQYLSSTSNKLITV